MRAWPSVAALLGLMAGCADAGTSTGPGSASKTTASTSTESAPAPEGRDAAAALSGFACARVVGTSERWTATGTLTNDGATPATYRVTVVVVDSAGSAGIGSQRLVRLGPSEASQVRLARVQGPLDGTCQVQVLRLD